MTRLESLIAEYCGLLETERTIAERKDELKAAIESEMQAAQLDNTKTASGSVDRAYRFKLQPKREEILSLLDSEDLFPFTHFTPTKVKEILVPRYGRESLIPLFDIEKTEYLQIKRPSKTRREP